MAVRQINTPHNVVVSQVKRKRKGRGVRIDDKVKARFLELWNQGWAVTAAAKEVGISQASGYKIVKAFKEQVAAAEAAAPPKVVVEQEEAAKEAEEAAERSRVTTKVRHGEIVIGDALPESELSTEALRARTDFDYFLRRYFGFASMPWQVKAVETVMELLATSIEEYLVVNLPPGVGKSTIFTQALPLWAICRDRGIRIQVGSKAITRTKDYVRRIRRELQRPIPVPGSYSTMPLDYGTFKPRNAEMWRIDEFIVEQLDGVAPEEKEPTVAALSFDSEFLGARANLIVWDDLVDYKNSRTPEMREKLAEFWELMAETRLEPGGLIVLQGQRVGTGDLYRHALDLMDPVAKRPKYHRVIFPAHHDDMCTDPEGDHLGLEAWPKSCLLDPRRASWSRLMMVMTNNRRRYEITYQQKDHVEGYTLCNELWLEGGESDGEIYPGCYDFERVELEPPPARSGPYLSVVTVDPSPNNFWAVQWWVYYPSTEERFLIATFARQMGANDFLDMSLDGTYHGLFHDLVTHAHAMGKPIKHLIFERNAAQKFVLQYQFFTGYLRTKGIQLRPHNTTSNKNDEQYGVQTIGRHYRLGRVRIPMGNAQSKRSARRLVDELTTWPEARTEDQVMAHWFLEWNIPRMAAPLQAPTSARTLPSWLKPTMRQAAATALGPQRARTLAP